MTRVVALVQARMGSTRFPGKMLAKLGDYPILEWVLRRLCRSHSLGEIVLATTNQGADEGLLEIASQCGVGVFRGSEDDVLGRFVEAATAADADLVVRVCADNPLIDSVEVDRLILESRKHPTDYAFNHQDRLGSRYADGFGAELLSMEVLSEIAAQSSKPEHREHVSKYIWDHPEKYSICAVPSPAELAFPNLRFDVDTPEDLEHLQSLVGAGVNLATPAAQIVAIERRLSEVIL